MSDQKQYHQHIERAIQNVLSKVKSPEKALKSPAPQTRIPQAKPKSEESAIISGGRLRAEDKNSVPQASSPAAETASVAPQDAEPVYVDAEDLYTPVALHEETEEAENTPPLIEDTYTAPYNLFEEFVETELNILLSRYLDLCRCSQCRADIVALALQQLPAYYVTGTRGTLTAKSVIWTRYMQEVMDAVTKSIHIVYKRPRNTCRKIKQVLWVRPELEDVSTEEHSQNLFGNLPNPEPELVFSPEIEAIIQTIESLPDEARHDLPPTSAPPSDAQTPAPPSFQAEPSVEMSLLDIDEWESLEEKVQ